MAQVKPYWKCATRLENRGKKPPTSGYVDELVRGLRESGVEATWHSAVNYDGMPLFPSKVFPDCHSDANLDAFRYLIDSVHDIGKPVISWYPMNLGAGVLKTHPDWKMRFFPVDGVQKYADREDVYVCFNSPYGKLLPEFAAEVVRDVGFDGLWFDGSTMSYHESRPFWLPGCSCDWCRDRFKRDTGKALPEKVDYDNRVFKEWVCWRYDVVIGLWKSCAEAVKSVRDDAVVCFNNYRRRNPNVFAWNVGIPLAKMDCDCMLSGELDGFPHQVDFQIKMHRAYGCRKGVETWWPLRDHFGLWVPDFDPLPAIQASLGAISAGGATCMGIGVNLPPIVEGLNAIEEQAGPRIQFIDGQPVDYLGIWCSQQDQDFGCRDNPNHAWDRWHGANEIGRHSHWQTGVVFDDHVSQDELESYPVIVVGSTRCISDVQAENLKKYVEAGGVIVACEQVGTLDEWGDKRGRPVLDDLLGIRARRDAFHFGGGSTLEIADENLKKQLGKYVTVRWKNSHPVVAEPCDGVAKVAKLVERKNQLWDGAGLDDVPEPRVEGCWINRVGKGAAIWMCCDLFAAYLESPTPQMRKLLNSLLVGLKVPHVYLDGPICVTMNTRMREDGELMVHLHNAPGTVYSYPNPAGSNLTHTPGEVLPVSGITLRLPGRKVVSAKSGLTGRDYAIGDDQQSVSIPLLELHEVVLLESKPVVSVCV